MSGDKESSVGHELHDVLIIGGGPAGLAVAARLSEHMPAANFTDDEHSRYHFINKHKGRMSHRSYKTNAVTTARRSAAETKPSMVVLDGSGDRWMSRWDMLFKTFGIDHLRSPMFFHVDPAERDGLLSYAHVQGRGHELREIRNCVGKEISKHHLKKRVKSRRHPDHHPNIDERDRNDYFVPSTPLFASHCGCLMDRYCLRNDMVRHENVIDIRYHDFDICPDDKVFEIRTNEAVYYSKTAVLAVGPGNPPSVPAPFTSQDEAVTHAMQIKVLPSRRVQEKIESRQQTNILIVGGGLTSAQLADLAVRRGVSKVWLLVRGAVKIKPFDVGLEWVGKYRNFEQAAFWTADSTEERWEKIKAARGGGSITGPYREILNRHRKAGRVKLCEHTTIAGKRWDDASQTWHVDLAGPHDDEDVPPPFDHVYFATGIQTDFATLPYLQSLLREYPVKSCGGLPCITGDMQWRDDVPLFVTGRLGALQLGPGAPNLVGARVGADRVCWPLQRLLETRGEGASQGRGRGDMSDATYDYATGRGSRFDVFGSRADGE